MKLQTLPKFAGYIGLFLAAKNAYTQTYILPEQLLPAFGPGISTQAGFLGGLSWGNGTVSGTVAINPTAYTIEQSGSVSITAASSSFQATQSQLVITPQSFPLGPTTNLETATLTVNVEVAGGTFSFDTGTDSLVWNGSEYTYNANASIRVPLSISYSLVTGGQTYTGSDDNLALNFPLTFGDQVNTENYPTSISLSPAASWIDQPNYSTATVANFTAADGFQVDIVAEVPEPNSLAVLSCALGVLGLVKRRQS